MHEQSIITQYLHLLSTPKNILLLCIERSILATYPHMASTGRFLDLFRILVEIKRLDGNILGIEVDDSRRLSVCSVSTDGIGLSTHEERAAFSQGCFFRLLTVLLIVYGSHTENL